MSAQAEPRGGSGVWDFLRNLSEKQKGSSSEQMPEEHPRMRIGRYAAAVLPAALLLYYCTRYMQVSIILLFLQAVGRMSCH